MFNSSKNNIFFANNIIYKMKITTIVATNNAGPNGKFCFIVYLKAIIWSSEATNTVTKVSIGER